MNKIPPLESFPTQTLDRLILVYGRGFHHLATRNFRVISKHFDDAPIYTDIGYLNRDYQFEDFTEAVLISSYEPVVTQDTMQPRFIVKHGGTLIFAREVRLETFERLRGDVAGWVDATPEDAA